MTTEDPEDPEDLCTVGCYVPLTLWGSYVEGGNTIGGECAGGETCEADHGRDSMYVGSIRGRYCRYSIVVYEE